MAFGLGVVHSYKQAAKALDPAPCESVVLSSPDRTKMFHVKHFGAIDP
jgi:hypothetical protein